MAKLRSPLVARAERSDADLAVHKLMSVDGTAEIAVYGIEPTPRLPRAASR